MMKLMDSFSMVIEVYNYVINEQPAVVTEVSTKDTNYIGEMYRHYANDFSDCLNATAAFFGVDEDFYYFYGMVGSMMEQTTLDGVADAYKTAASEFDSTYGSAIKAVVLGDTGMAADALAKAAAFNQADFTAADWTALQTCISNYNAALEKYNAAETADQYLYLPAVFGAFYKLYNQVNLMTAKKNAKAYLDAFVESLVEDDYSEDNWALIQSLLAQGKALIDAQTTTAKITEARNAAIAAINDVPTKVDVQAAKDELDSYVDPMDYDGAEGQERDQITAIISEAKAAIDLEDSLEDIDAIVAEAEAAIDALPTAAEKELAAYKEEKIAYLNDVWSQKTPDDYVDEVAYQAAQAAYEAGIAAINAATSIGEVDTAYATADAAIATGLKISA